MQETSVPPDSGFIVDWQLSDEAPVLIDLSGAEPEVVLPDEAPFVRSAPARR
jgi:hypothetical protein